MPTVSDHYTLLLLYFVVFFLLTFVLRSVLVYRRTGINPLVLPRTQDAYGYVGLAFKVLMLLCACTVTALATVPSAPECLGAIRPLEHGVVRALGWLLLMACLVWMLVAQAHMGASWRIGIDSARRTELVRTGLFAVSRNPIFLAVRLALLGLFFGGTQRRDRGIAGGGRGGGSGAGATRGKAPARNARRRLCALLVRRCGGGCRSRCLTGIARVK